MCNRSMTEQNKINENELETISGGYPGDVVSGDPVVSEKHKTCPKCGTDVWEINGNTLEKHMKSSLCAKLQKLKNAR